MLQIRAGDFARNYPGRHAQNRSAAWDIADNERVGTYDDVIADVDSPDDLGAGTKVDIIPNRSPADAAHVHNTGSLIERAAMTDLFRQHQNAGEVVNYETWPDFRFA
ncbi:MAG TPA: hypothetical protein VFJ88_04885, partial [Chthoniobacterales bacterium]|nr:hypothetical protein [Chthoniobacterales bacterium]